jgi:hypothetical protein
LQLVQALQLQHLLQPNSAHLMFSRALVAEGCCVWLKQGAFNAKGKLAEFIKAAASYVHVVEQELDVSGGHHAVSKVLYSVVAAAAAAYLVEQELARYSISIVSVGQYAGRVFLEKANFAVCWFGSVHKPIVLAKIYVSGSWKSGTLDSKQR